MHKLETYTSSVSVLMQSDSEISLKPKCYDRCHYHLHIGIAQSNAFCLQRNGGTLKLL